MGKISAIARRELLGFFCSPMGYLSLFLYILFTGFFFATVQLVPGQLASFAPMFDLNHFILIIVVPFITMSLLADEYRSGRIEVLRTSPLTEMDLVLGKFFGALGFYCVMVACTLFFVLVMAIFGRPDYNTIWTGYLGLLLLGALCVAVGLFFSSLTQHQIVAAMSTCLTLFCLSVMAQLYMEIPATAGFWRGLRHTVRYLWLQPHMNDFARGIIDTRHLVFFVTGTFFFLFLTYVVLESRKWR